jgi:phospholipid/cholesterol/gamma-HCH transport system substrate-binding protein
MENRSYALLAGAFTLALLAATIALAVWINRDRSTLIDYEIVSTSAVGGLSAQSPVRYQGVPVGKVQALGLDPDHPGQVRIRIGVRPGTPITTSTWAELGVQGVTGLANVDLRDDGSSPTRLVPTQTRIPQIPLRPGLFERLQQSGTQILANVEVVSARLRDVLDEKNVQALNQALHNASDLSITLRELGEELKPVAGKIGPLVDNLNETSRQAGRAAQDIGALAVSGRQALARLDGANGTLAMATRTLQQISRVAVQLSSDTLPAVTGMASQVGVAAGGISYTARRVGEAPQSLLFGAPPPLPGPGEAGFKGFGGGAQ